MSRFRTRRRLVTALVGTLTTLTLLAVTTSPASADAVGETPPPAAEQAAPAQPENDTETGDPETGEGAPTSDPTEGSTDTPVATDPASDATAEDAEDAVDEDPAAADEAVAEEAPEAATTASSAPAATAARVVAPAEATEVGPAPGNRGTVKIHRSTTDDADRRNEPKVCEFRIVGFGFPDDANLEITIEGHGGPNAGPDSFAATVTAGQLSAEGDFAIAGPQLADGMYKLFVDNTTAPGGSKQKVFKVSCDGEEEPEAEELDRTLRLSKVTAGGGTPEAGAFLFDVDCGEAFDDTVEVDAGQTVTVSDDLPFGTECTIEEVEDRGADGTEIAVDPADAVETKSARVITVRTVEESISVTVTFTNTFDAAPIVLSEVIATADDGAAPAVARVLGVQAQQLPRTGQDLGDPALLAGMLIGLGVALRLQARRQVLRHTA